MASRRVMSIYVLRLFNDAVESVTMQLALLLLVYNRRSQRASPATPSPVARRRTAPHASLIVDALAALAAPGGRRTWPGTRSHPPDRRVRGGAVGAGLAISLAPSDILSAQSVRAEPRSRAGDGVVVGACGRVGVGGVLGVAAGADPSTTSPVAHGIGRAAHPRLVSSRGHPLRAHPALPVSGVELVAVAVSVSERSASASPPPTSMATARTHCAFTRHASRHHRGGVSNLPATATGVRRATPGTPVGAGVGDRVGAAPAAADRDERHPPRCRSKVTMVPFGKREMHARTHARTYTHLSATRSGPRLRTCHSRVSLAISC
eukprot:ctg_100.g93